MIDFALGYLSHLTFFFKYGVLDLNKMQSVSLVSDLFFAVF